MKSHIVCDPIYEVSRIGNSLETESRFMAARGWGWEGGMGSNSFTGTGFPFGVIKMFGNLTEAVVAPYCECTKCHGTVPFKMAIVL